MTYVVGSKIEFCVEPLNGKLHNRAEFNCGIESLDSYLKTQATQDQRRKANAVFVLVDIAAPRTIAGYFTLFAYGLAPGAVPEEARKHLPRYPLVSATLLGRLAIARSHQGRGAGGALLAHALRKAYESAHVVGSSMVVVDAIDDRAVAFYVAHGFEPLAISRRLAMPMSVVAKVIA